MSEERSRPSPAAGEVAPRARRARSWRLLHLLVLVAIAVLAYEFIDLGEVLRLVRSADLRFVGGILVLATLDRVLMAWKWRLLLLAVDVRQPFHRLLDAYYQSSVVSYVPMMVVGSDLLRGYLVIRETGRTGAVLATMIMEKVLGVLSSCILGVAGLGLVLGSMEREHAGTLAGIALGSLLLSIAVFAASLHEPFYRRIAAGLARVLPARATRALEELHASYALFRRQPRVLAVNMGLTVLEHAVQFTMLLLAGYAIGVQMPLLLFLAVIGLVLMVRRVAIYLEGWGFAETVSVVLFSLVGLDRNTALTLSLVVNGVNMLAVSPGALLLARGSWRLAEVDLDTPRDQGS